MPADRHLSNVGESGVTQNTTSVYDLSGTAVDATYQTFGDSPAADGEDVWVRLNSEDSDKYEVGLFTFNTGSPNTLTRVSTTESSNADSAVDFGTESIEAIASVIPGQKAVSTDLASFEETVEVTAAPAINLSGSGAIQDAGSDAITFDGSANITVPNQSTFNADVTVNAGISSDAGNAVLIEAAGNTNQIVARTDGNVAMANRLKVGGTGAAAGTAEFAGTGTVYINETANSNMTTGLTINQGGADDEILALKSSNVSHEMTGVVESDTYGFIEKVFGGSGGLKLSGVRDSGDAPSVELSGYAAAVDTTKSTSAQAVAGVTTQMTDGAGGIQDVTADGNLFRIVNRTTARFIFDAEGSAHADVEWTTFDEHDDPMVLRDLEALLVPREFGSVMEHDRQFFERTGLLHDVREVGPGRMRGMLNQTRLLMLHTGAIVQNRQHIEMVADDHENRIEMLERENKRLRRRVNALAN